MTNTAPSAAETSSDRIGNACGEAATHRQGTAYWPEDLENVIRCIVGSHGVGGSPIARP
jgi:hypothetical protein